MSSPEGVDLDMEICEQPSDNENINGFNDTTEMTHWHDASNWQDGSSWDLLMTTGSGKTSDNVNKWERESLYQKFDPLASAPHQFSRLNSERDTGDSVFDASKNLMPPPSTPMPINNNFLSPKSPACCPLERNRTDIESESFCTPSEEFGVATGNLINICTPSPKPKRVAAAQFQNNSGFSPLPQPNFEEEESGFGGQPSISPRGDMSPSFVNKHCEMNGTISIEQRVKEAMAAREREFEMILQDKVNIINEMEEKFIQLEMKNEDDSLSRVLTEYEKTMSGYIQQIDELKEKLEAGDDEKLKIIRERDQALEDLRNVESAFSDVHRKYERAKGLLENFRKNEEILKRRDQEMLEKISHRDSRIEQYKEKLKNSLEQLHNDYEGRIKEMETEANRHRVLIRKADLKVETLQNDVEHKSREISKLSGLCDELINGGVN